MTYSQRKRKQLGRIIRKYTSGTPLEFGEVRALERISQEKGREDAEGSEAVSEVDSEAE